MPSRRANSASAACSLIFKGTHSAISEIPPLPGAQSPATNSQDSTNDLSLSVGKSVVLDLARPVTRIVVGIGGFAEAQAVSPTQILLSGKGAGETSLIIWDQSGGRQFFNVTVRPSSFASNDVLEGIRREAFDVLLESPLEPHQRRRFVALTELFRPSKRPTLGLTVVPIEAEGLIVPDGGMVDA